MITLLIDGRSGSGKTELASAIASSWPEAQLVRLDDLYPGWSGLEVGSRYAYDQILASDAPRWQRWDWFANERQEWHELDPSRPLILEGVGALTGANRAVASYGIWVETDDETRKARALARDGESYESHWDDWAAQEVLFMDREQPARHADSVVFGHSVATGADRWRAVVEAASMGE